MRACVLGVFDHMATWTCISRGQKRAMDVLIHHSPAPSKQSLSSLMFSLLGWKPAIPCLHPTPELGFTGIHRTLISVLGS